MRAIENGIFTLPPIDQLHNDRPTVGTYRPFRDLFGPDVKSILSGIPLDPDAVSNIRERFLKRVKERFRATDPEAFYIGQLAHANDFIGDMADKLFPDRRDEVGLLNEVAILTEDPFAALEHLLVKDADSRLRFETGRQLYLAYLAAGINSRTRRSRTHSELHDMYAILNDELFSGARGGTDNIRLKTLHDNVTNRCLEYGYELDIHPGELEDRKAHVKRFHFEVRSVEGVGGVLTKPRKKTDRAVMAKALVKSLSGEPTTIQGTERDSMGVLFVVFGEDAGVDALLDKVITIFDSKGIVDEVESDNDTDTDRGQSHDVRFERRLVHFKGREIPLEVMVYTLTDYINSRYEIGRQNEETGEFNGPAHKLYTMRRLSMLAPYLFPDALYAHRGGDDSLASSVRRSFDHVAEELLLANRAEV